MVERILELIKQGQMSDYSLERKLGFTQGTISNWRRGKNKVSTEAVIKLAQYFNVSADYLLCLTDEPKSLYKSDLKERPTYSLSTELTELSKDKRFVNTAKVYKELSDEYRQEVYAYILGIAIGLGLNIKKILK